ncbi:MAG TPA: hypothetical protein VJU61_11700 [Polyangiaceae bacterium]|nr:hypothetical protein [Polyangiaceae bacterium]
MRARLRLKPEQAAFVADRVRHFARDAPETWSWQRGYVQEHRALPLYLGWTETLGIQPDGFLVRWSTEAEYDGVKSIVDPIECAVALTLGAERYPELQSLVPDRPRDVQHCSACAGLGRFPQQPEVICECGGLGWRPRSLEDLGVLCG